MHFQAFNTYEDMMSEVERARDEADGQVQPWQAVLAPGDFFIRIWSGLVIYGEILDPAVPQFPGDYSDEALSEIRREARIYEQPEMRGYRFTRCYSVACPEGEFGDTHVSSMTRKITREQFEQARASGWPEAPWPRR
ncbi:MAG: hypothetical protein HY907_06045 [Deltaproteobacteria bacterium]|nr:hypothetical protein [Deltaproteobacteria bacterium]